MSVQDSNSLFSDIGATHAYLMEAAQSFVCVSIGIHSDDWHQLYMYKRGKPIRMMALLPTSQNLFMHILQAIML